MTRIDPSSDAPVRQLSWSSRMFRWEFLVIALLLVLCIAAGVYTTVKHGDRPPGGLEPVKTPQTMGR